MSRLKIVGVIAGAIAFVALIVFATIKSSDEQAAWDANCQARGGHVDKVSKTSTGTGIDGKGRPVVTTSTQTTYYCLSDDGRILDIR